MNMRMKKLVGFVASAGVVATLALPAIVGAQEP